jgi:dynactin 1
VETDSDVTSYYLFFRCLGSKAGFINDVGVAQMLKLPEALNGEVFDMLVGLCEV